jgi:ATP/ADP translocase
VPDKVPKKKAKKKGTIADSLAVLRSSPKTMNLALLVMSYGVSHRLFEFAWKGQLQALYPSAQAYQVQLSSLAAQHACLPLKAVAVRLICVTQSQAPISISQGVITTMS